LGSASELWSSALLGAQPSDNTAGNRKRPGWEEDRGRDSGSKCWASTRNSVPISINASFVRISILLRASLRYSSAFVCSSFGVGVVTANVSHKLWQKLAALKVKSLKELAKRLVG
jgi:hypothetical protein